VFIHVFTAKVLDAEGLRRQAEKWEDELRPPGVLGSTGGITADGRYILMVLFETPEDAQAIRRRPEQGRWWMETQKFIEDAQFFDSVEIRTVDRAGTAPTFVRVMAGRVLDPQGLKEMSEQHDHAVDLFRAHRPDFLGEDMALYADGTFHAAWYHTSEAEARAGEAKPVPPVLKVILDDLDQLRTFDETWELTDPWIR
jgi:hypothetical protein